MGRVELLGPPRAVGRVLEGSSPWGCREWNAAVGVQAESTSGSPKGGLMRGVIAWIYCAVALYAVSGITPAAQAPPILRVEPWEGDSRVQLVPLDEASASTYARHFESANGRVARQFALKLTNGTESTIAAVALRWTMTTNDGPRVIIERLLSYCHVFGWRYFLLILNPLVTQLRR